MNEREIWRELHSALSFNGIPRKICLIYARELIRICDVWSYNRRLNQEHITKIENDLKTQKYPNLLGTIKLIFKNNEYKVIDGQHRLQAIINVIKNDETMKWDFILMVEIYNVSDLNDEVINDLYIKANKNLNINVEDELNLFLMELINKLEKDTILKAGIIDKQDGSVYRPRISKKDLYEKLKKYYIKKPDDTVELIYEKIKQKNREIGIMNTVSLFGDVDSKMISQYDKAVKINFFLNMNCKIPIEKWIKEL